MVYRIFVEKKSELANEAAALKSELTTTLRLSGITSVRILNCYDVENIDKDLFDYAVKTVFSEPQLDITAETITPAAGEHIFAVEYLPGQFDQRADSAAQCIQLISQKEKPTVKTARVYILKGAIADGDLAAVKKYLINPVESREASLDLPQTLQACHLPPERVEVLTGFTSLDKEGLKDFLTSPGSHGKTVLKPHVTACPSPLAMDEGDIAFCQAYFKKEGRDPTITEIRMIDTYWSDHCRHTTFLTTIDSVKTDSPLLQKAFNEYMAVRKAVNRTKPVNLMDIGTIAARYLKAAGQLDKLDESDEINACTVKITVTVNGNDEDWLLLFKNETHNHPTEIEPFGGAATCIGGAIRDPLSGRAYVYAAMRLTGAGNPLTPVSETLPGKLPQRKLVTSAAAGYSSYGNQIGLATGIVDEIYHDGYVAKHMELGAVIGAAPAKNVRRETPAAGDAVILLGGRTGRDGCGGATGSSKSHTEASLETCGSEVQKGNAPEERKIQRLFRNPAASTLIKRCNDFGAGGVSVAIGELADGLDINLNAVPKKYDGLDGTELAISESQERMAVVVAAEDAERFIALAKAENLEATIVARVTAEPRLVMRWNGEAIVDISREFLASNGSEKHITVEMDKPEPWMRTVTGGFAENYRRTAGDLNTCSRRGLSERFDSTIGAGTVLMPFGGKYQMTPIQAMVNKIPVEHGDTDACSLMAWGYNPFIAEKSPYHASYLAVAESVCKLVATGAEFSDVYLSLQEFFEKLGSDPKRWGKPASALLGAFAAQMGLGVGAIGGKDSMSGSFEKLDVPPTLVSFAVTTEKIPNIISNDLKGAGHRLVWIRPEYDAEHLPTAASMLKNFATVTRMMRAGQILSCSTPGLGGVADAVFKAALGNGIGVSFADGVTAADLFGYAYGSFVAELAEGADAAGVLLGMTTEEPALLHGAERVTLAELTEIYEGKLETVYPCNIVQGGAKIEKISCTERSTARPHVRAAHPRVLIPVFPGTNCEYDSAKAVAAAGAVPEIFVINTMTAEDIAESVEKFAAAVRRSQAIFIPGGFSGGDEPDGSGKFITAFFRNAKIKDAVHDLLKNRDGLMCGICNGFQALIKLGLVPYGEIRDTDAESPTLTFNTIGRHQSRLVRVRVASVKSPWLSQVNVDDVFAVPISHGEGRFLANDAVVRELIANGQVATQYVDLEGNPTSEIHFNPNNSVMAIEGITSPDGRVLGKMGHAERIGNGLYKNVGGEYEMGLFKSLVAYYAE
ncbi:MAG: phosphoribosylformylglycinamidine synthase [Methanocorpusculum sp.]|nr:phosphoribosylformylglycinamidine synthase [Methanocorpusculum sp.]